MVLRLFWYLKIHNSDSLTNFGRFGGIECVIGSKKNWKERSHFHESQFLISDAGNRNQDLWFLTLGNHLSKSIEPWRIDLHFLQVLRVLAALVVELEHLALTEELVEESADLAGAAVLDGGRVLLLHPPVQVERVQEPPIVCRQTIDSK